MFPGTQNWNEGTLAKTNSYETALLFPLDLDGPTRKPRHASVFSMHSDTQVDPPFYCVWMFNGIFSTHGFLKRTDTLSTNA